jgi:hypothetical protein
VLSMLGLRAGVGYFPPMGWSTPWGRRFRGGEATRGCINCEANLPRMLPADW